MCDSKLTTNLSGRHLNAVAVVLAAMVTIAAATVLIEIVR